MDKAALLEQFGISDRTLRRWCDGLGITFNQPKYSEAEVEQLTKIKELLAIKISLDDAIAQITGKRPEPKQAPGRYSNLPGQLQPKAVARALVQQFDQDVMTEVFHLLSQPMTRQEVSQYMDVISSSNDIVDVSYLLEAGVDD